MRTAAIIASLTAMATANSCFRNDNGIYTYTVTTDNTLPDISGVCGGLWDNLKRFSACTPSNTFCGANGAENKLRWSFNVPNVCNGGMIESTWWEATRNNYGSIDCP